MKTVTTIHLNGRAYQVEDEAHKALAAYLESAAAALANDPDKDEILADFETAIAEKFAKYLTPQKNVITHKEVETIIGEMGPVNGAREGGEGQPGAEKSSTHEGTVRPKRLYRITDGKMLAGVCNGIAAYFDIDVVIVRIVFVALTLISHGIGILAYLILMLVMPKATEAEARAHAAPIPLNAHEFIEAAKKNYAELKGESKEWKRRWQRERQAWKYKEREAKLERMRLREERENPWRDTAIGILWLAIMIGSFVALYRYVPFFHHNFDRLGHLLTTKMDRLDLR